MCVHKLSLPLPSTVASLWQFCDHTEACNEGTVDAVRLFWWWWLVFLAFVVFGSFVLFVVAVLFGFFLHDQCGSLRFLW